MKNLSDHLSVLNKKKVIIRCNFDVPIENSHVKDTTRIEDAISTIKTAIEHNSSIVLLAHYDRPDGKYDESKSLKPVAQTLSKLLSLPVNLVEYKKDYSQISIPSTNKISLLDNLRFWSQEEDNKPEFVKFLSSLGEVFINQAFANCHREHASIVGIPKHLPSYAGINLAQEVQLLSKTRNNPQQPLVVVIGGAKLETKEPLVEVFADKAKNILVGGKVALDLKDKGPLPDNVIIAQTIPDGKDITPESANQFAQIIKSAKTVIWNGTMGVFEDQQYQTGTKIVAEAIDSTSAFTLVGGGDTETALTVLDLEDGIDFISTGGGAMLTFLSEGTLIGLQALNQT